MTTGYSESSAERFAERVKSAAVMLRQIAYDVERIQAAPSLRFPDRIDFGRAACEVVHTVEWGVANLDLAGLVRVASDAQLAPIIEREVAKESAGFTLADAIDVATRAHAHQTRSLPDGSTEPYVCHPLRVMANVKGAEAQMAAVLHDVLEDTDETWESLRGAGVPERVIEMVFHLTRGGDETYEGFIETIARIGSSTAFGYGADVVAIKLADLADNIAGAWGEYERLVPRWKKAVAVLSA